MSDSLIQSDLSELVIGLLPNILTEKSRLLIHIRVLSFYMRPLATFRCLHLIMCGLCRPCVRYGFRQM